MADRDASIEPGPAYLDPDSGQRLALDTPLWRSAAGRPLMIAPLAGMTRIDIDRTQRSLWRYATSLPVRVADPITLGEGCTPLVRRPVDGLEALFKLEWMMPSGSFKDRGASVMLSVLRQQGIAAVLEDSSGNGGAAIACYAAAGGLRAKILVPASTQPSKIVQMRAYGAEVELVDGPRQATADEAVRQSDRIFYASHNWQPFFLQGTKTLAYEMWEDLGYPRPGQRHHSDGGGQQRARLRHRLRRADARWRDRAIAAAVWRAAGTLRANPCELHRGGSTCQFRSRPARPLRKALQSQSRSGFGR